MKAYFNHDEFTASSPDNSIVIMGTNINCKPFHFEPRDLDDAKANFKRLSEEYIDYIEGISNRCWINFDEEGTREECEKAIAEKFSSFMVLYVDGVFESFTSDIEGEENLDAAMIAYEFYGEDEYTIECCAAYLDAFGETLVGMGSKNDLICAMDAVLLGKFDSFEELCDDQLYMRSVLGEHEDTIRSYICDDTFYKEIYEEEEGCEVLVENDIYFKN